MRTEKVSLTLEEELLAEAREVAGPVGFRATSTVRSANSCSTIA